MVERYETAHTKTKPNKPTYQFSENSAKQIKGVTQAQNV